MGKEEDDKIYKSTFTFGFNPELLKLVNDARAHTHTKDKTKSFKVKRDKATELLNKLAELQQQKQREKQKETYRQLVDANGEKSDFE